MKSPISLTAGEHGLSHALLGTASDLQTPSENRLKTHELEELRIICSC